MNVIDTNPKQAATMLGVIAAWDESLPMPSAKSALQQANAVTESTDARKSIEGKRRPTKKQDSKGKAEETSDALYPWRNVTGSLQQNWFELPDGLKNSQYIFEVEKKGTVAFVGGSITGMPWRKKVMENLKRRFPCRDKPTKQ